jgi:enediyne biosynthesis protein E3
MVDAIWAAREYTSLRPRSLLLLSPAVVDFDRRGFPSGPTETRAVLEAAAGAFVTGFNAELAVPPAVAAVLEDLPEDRRGFAAEGAGMAAALLDLLNPVRGRRLATVRAAHESRYSYLIHVGVGWALAKLRRRRLGSLLSDAPLLRWLAYDGMGFCRAFFASSRELRRWSAHPARCEATCDIRHQGLGRSLWFRTCGDPATAAEHIERLAPRHHGDAWSGLGLAAAYAGGVSLGVIEQLREIAGEHCAAVAQGAAFAAEAWQHSGYLPENADAAVQILTGVGVPQAAAWTWDARRSIESPDAGPADYRCWRLRIQKQAAGVLSVNDRR